MEEKFKNAKVNLGFYEIIVLGSCKILIISCSFTYLDVLYLCQLLSFVIFMVSLLCLRAKRKGALFFSAE